MATRVRAASSGSPFVLLLQALSRDPRTRHPGALRRAPRANPSLLSRVVPYLWEKLVSRRRSFPAGPLPRRCFSRPCAPSPREASQIVRAVRGWDHVAKVPAMMATWDHGIVLAEDRDRLGGRARLPEPPANPFARPLSHPGRQGCPSGGARPSYFGTGRQAYPGEKAELHRALTRLNPLRPRGFLSSATCLFERALSSRALSARA